MDIPVVKTLFKYRDHVGNGEFIVESIVNSFVEGDDKYHTLEYILENENPFADKYEDLRFECYMRADGSYALTAFDDYYKPSKTFDVFVQPVLEFKGKLFELNEVR